MYVAQSLGMTLETLDLDQLAAITGGMNWQDFRRSTNIEDRRPPEAIAEDDAWMKSLPMTDAWKRASDQQTMDQWVRNAQPR